ncbi:MAG TPA: hypothetical protein VIS76_02865, partial [Pseudomonadales bacterium]
MGDRMLSESLTRCARNAQGDDDHGEGWLASFGSDLQTSFVYRAWVDAGGALEPVRAHMLAWLEKHGTEPEARYVLLLALRAARKEGLNRAAVEFLNTLQHQRLGAFLLV